jgi:hypothetical protein
MTGVNDQRLQECDHPGCATSEVEQHARDACAAVLGDAELIRVCAQTSAGPIPDFQSRRYTVEVKALTSPALMKFLTARNKNLEDPHHPVKALSQTWGVFADVSEAHGSFDGKASAPRISSMIKSLTPLLVEVEARGLTDVFAAHDLWPQFAKTLGFYGHCSVMPSGPFPPGIVFIGPAHETSRTTYLEHDVVAFLQQWLNSEHSDNARKSLADRPGRRVLTLVASFDGPAAAMLHTLHEHPGVAPQTPLRLPAAIDVVAVLTGNEVLLFDASSGWARRTLQSQGA